MASAEVGRRCDPAWQGSTFCIFFRFRTGRARFGRSSRRFVSSGDYREERRVARSRARGGAAARFGLLFFC
jgi:hypothetical protein